MTKSKPWRRFLPILLAVLLALGIALYAVPLCSDGQLPKQCTCTDLRRPVGGGLWRENRDRPLPRGYLPGLILFTALAHVFPTPSPRKS